MHLNKTGETQELQTPVVSTGKFRPSGRGGQDNIHMALSRGRKAFFSPSHNTKAFFFKGLFGFVTPFFNGHIFHIQVFEYILLGHGWSLEGLEGQLSLRYF